ncbi:MAG: aromatic amino acid hydroxylase [Bacteroidota bacterium]|nr:aromatic amino acid hydroxylase [Bacteroidota bacterium]
MNEVLNRLPKHLMDLVIDQPYNKYTPQDHAVWRYVMRRNVDYLRHVAHESYLEGLRKTGISIECIPHMYGMNRILKEIGWAAVAVDGFIPPAAFMEFQACNVLVIAADIRPIDQIEYTPAPDIIHEAAGHAPIIADHEYAAYLKYFGEIGAKAFSSAKDYEQYEAIRHLSILKADPYTTKEDIDRASQELEEINQNIGMPSEMSLIRNLHWWTVEYGLIGEPDKPKIYGAGLLSSIGESYNSLQPKVKKIPYTLDAKDYSFDITTQQPQLFVTPDFGHLNTVLDEFVSHLALSNGGLDGIGKAIESGHTATCVWSSGLQVSGTFTEVISQHEQPAYLKTSGPTQLAYKDKELEGHGKDYHKDGFGSPVGKLKGVNTPLRFLSDSELRDLKIIQDEPSVLEFESGVIVEGVPTSILRKEGKIILLTFDECKVMYRNKLLFEPSRGIFDMAVGDEISSAFNGPADADAFKLRFPVPKEKTHKIKHTEGARRLHSMYSQVREIREKKIAGQDHKVIKQLEQAVENGEKEKLNTLWEILKKEYPDDWLLPLEIIELLNKGQKNSTVYREISQFLRNMISSHPELEKVITNGLIMARVKEEEFAENA